MVLYSHVRCLERSDRSVPGCRRRGGWTLAHAHPEPRHLFFCQAPAQPRACGGGCAGRYTLSFIAWFVLCFICNTFVVGSRQRVYLMAVQMYLPLCSSNSRVTVHPSTVIWLHQIIASCLLSVEKVLISLDASVHKR